MITRPALALVCGRVSLVALGLALLALAPPIARPAAAQETAAAPLPTVVYPLDVPGTSAPGVGSVDGAPQPQVTEGDRQYVFVDGVWGFWDRQRRFHQVPEAVVRGSLQRPVVAAPGAPRVNFRGAGLPHPPVRVQTASRGVVHLPNASFGRTFGGSFSAGGRGPVR